MKFISKFADEEFLVNESEAKIELKYHSEGVNVAVEIFSANHDTYKLVVKINDDVVASTDIDEFTADQFAKLMENTNNAEMAKAIIKAALDTILVDFLYNKEDVLWTKNAEKLHYVLS